MLTQHRSISLSYLSTNLEILVHIEAIATLYQKKNNTFHVVLNNVDFGSIANYQEKKLIKNNLEKIKNLIWLEISPYRVIMTQQNKNSVNYRHFWERGVYGKSRYWINEDSDNHHQKDSFHLRNFTRNLTLKNNSHGQSLRIEYELWSDNLNFGNYILHLEIN